MDAPRAPGSLKRASHLDASNRGSGTENEGEARSPTEQSRGFAAEGARELAERLNAACLIVDRDTKEIVEVGPGAAALFGMAPGAPDSASLLDRVLDEDRDAVDAALAGDASMGAEIEFRCRTASGEERWIRSLILPLDDVARSAWISRDVTAAKQADERRADERALARLAEVTTVVAHEIKGPIASVQTGLEYLAPKLPEGSNERTLLGELVRRTRSLLRLAEDVLRFGRALSPAPVPIAVRQHITKAAEIVRDELRLDALRVEIDGPEVRLEVDEGMFAQALVQVLKNAAQAAGAEEPISVSVRRTGDRVVLEIQDRGPGIPVENRSRIFDPFFTTKNVGTGIGLPLVGRVMEAHGGMVNVDCPSAGGTVVRIELPLLARNANRGRKNDSPRR